MQTKNPTVVLRTCGIDVQGGCRCGKSRAPTAAAPKLSSPPESTDSDTSDLDNSHAADNNNSIIKITRCFDDEEIGSLLRQGAWSNISQIRTAAALAAGNCSPDFVFPKLRQRLHDLRRYFAHRGPEPSRHLPIIENHACKVNVAVAMQADPNDLITTNSISIAVLQRVAIKSKCNSKLQALQIPNDSRSGHCWIGAVSDDDDEFVYIDILES